MGDVLDDAYIKTLISKAAEFGGGKIHIIVNNAGYTWDGVIHKMTDKQWHTIVDLHATAPFKIVRAAAPYFRVKDGEPRNIINISSTSGVNGNAGQINYALAKAGVQGMTKTIAKESVLSTTLSSSIFLTCIQMGPTIRRTLEHGRFRTHSNAIDGSERSWRVHYDTRWREGGARHTAGPEGKRCRGPATYGYPAAKGRYRDGGGERGIGCRESAVQLCQRRDDQGHRWQGHVDVLMLKYKACNEILIETECFRRRVTWKRNPSEAQSLAAVEWARSVFVLFQIPRSWDCGQGLGDG